MTRQWPPVAAVVVNHNGGELTMASLASLRAQDYPTDRLQIVLVDTASNDGVADWVRRTWPEIRVVDAGSNIGFAGGVNLGIRHAAPDAHIALLNPDATAEPDWLSALVAALELDETVGAVNAKVLFAGRFHDVHFEEALEVRGVRQAGLDVWGRLQFVDGWLGPGYERGVAYQWSSGPAFLRVPAGPPVDLLVSRRGRPATWERVTPIGPAHDVLNSAGLILTSDRFGADRGYLEIDRGQHDLRAEIFAWTGSAVILRRAYLDSVGPLDERLFLYYEDLDHAWRGREAGWTYLCEPAAVAHHVHQASAGRSALTDILIERNRLIVLRRHAGQFKALRASARHLLVTGSYARRDVVRRALHGDRPSLVIVRRRLRALAGAAPYLARSK